MKSSFWEEDVFESLEAKGYQIEFHSHAKAILTVDFESAIGELSEALNEVRIPIEELVRGGGGEADITQRLRKNLAEKTWKKHTFEISKLIDGVPRESISHEIDHVRTFPDGKKIALEIEWNNKDPFLDRDLENFKRLHSEGAISIGVIVTRGTSLHQNMRSMFTEFARGRNIASFEALIPFGVEPTRRQRKLVEVRLKPGVSFGEAWAAAFCADKFGEATTHWRKLADRVARGVGNPCPLLLVGIPDSVVQMNPAI